MESSLAFPSPDHQQHPIVGAVAVKPKLPNHIILKSWANGLYLRYIDKPGSTYLSHLEFSGGNPLDKKSCSIGPKGKFEVQTSGAADDDCVHIKSCYNTNYLEFREDTNHITATATKPHAGTLFQIVYENAVSENKIIRLLHVSSKRFVSPRPSGRHQYLLEVGFASQDNETLRDLLTVIDWKTIVMLPKRLVFKGQNGMYLKACTYGGYPYMAFQSDRNDEELEANEITQKPDGTVSIRNEYFNKFWRSNDDAGGWIYVNADSDETAGVHFKPSALETNTKIALQSLHNGKFCAFSSDDKTRCLSASSDLMDEKTHMEFVEPVVSRVIDNVRYRLLDARKFDEKIVHAGSDHIQNTTNDPKTKFTKVITLADSNTSTWDYTAGVKLETSTTMKAGVPLIVDGKIEISAEIGRSYKWGGTDKEDTEVEGKLIANVPPKSKLTVYLTYTKGACEVPFSYVQHDTLTNGVSETTEMEGGLYTGTNCYSFKFETIQTAL